MHIVTFPFAGGNKYSYNFLNKGQDIVNLFFHFLEYPGRGSRYDEPLLVGIDHIIDDAIGQMEVALKNDDSPYVIYGHSMGALVGYLVCLRLQALKRKLPIKLIISGCRAPAFMDTGDLHHLPSQVFWERLYELGGVVEEILYSDIKYIFEPVLRADFQALESYQCVCGEQLSIPIDVFYGSTEILKKDHVYAWKEVTSGEVRIQELTGNHFFIYNQAHFFMDYFSKLFLGSCTRFHV